MDKYEYNIKADQIMKLIDRRDFKTAAKIADGIDWRRVRNINMLTNVGCIYQAVGRYTDAKEIFQLARNRAPLARRLVYQMADVCIDAGEFEEAERYIQEFNELAPKDTGRFELLYQLSRRKGEPIENQIAILEEFKKQDFDEKWTYELAKLYHKAGYAQKCIATCDELILWFGEGQYVEKAMELKMIYVPLSPSQQEKYDMHFKKKEGETVVPVSTKKNEEVVPVPEQRPESYNPGMYNTENLQAAIAKSMQEIMEAEEKWKAVFPVKRSYMDEYQSEQEEREAMFAATRDIRVEREKLKKIESQSDSPFMTAIDLSGATVMQNILVQEPEKEETAEISEGEEETAQQTIQELFDTKAFAESGGSMWQEEGEKETSSTKEGAENLSEAIEEEEENFEDIEDLEDVEESVEEIEDLENTEEEMLEEIEDFYYEIPGEEEPEYEEVPFSLAELDENEIPIEVYYTIPNYDPQPFLDKMSGRSIEEETLINAEEEEETIEKLREEKEPEKIEEPEEKAEIEEQPDFEEDEEEALEEEPEDFLLNMMTRSYGVEELPNYVYYQVPGYQDKAYESDPNEDVQLQEAATEEENFEEEEETTEYIYGVEELPAGSYYEVPGYDPTAFLEGSTSEQDLWDIPMQKPQKKVQKKPQKQVQKKPLDTAKADDIKHAERKTEQRKAEEKVTLELTPEYKKVFASYLHMPGVEHQIAEILDESEQIGKEQETSLFGNILLMGDIKSGKTTLAVSLIKTMNRLNGRKGRKIAKISGDRLNNKGIRESISRLVGADLIIEQAGEMKDVIVMQLLDAMRDYTGGMIVILEDTRTAIEQLLNSVPQISTCFTHTIDLKECNIADWAETAKNYAEEKNYIVDDMAMLALSAKIDMIYANKKNIEMEDIETVMDAAIEKADKRNKKLFGRIFSKKKDSEQIILRENDFN